MPRGIFLIHKDNSLTELREEPYDSEALLQQLLADHPSVLAGDDGSAGPKRWLLIKREAGIPSEANAGDRWAVDHVFLDQDAVPTLVEVKRRSDTRIRREVVGQMLDYAANMSAHWSPERLRAEYERRCETEELSPEDRLAQLLGPEIEVEAFWERAKTNLQAGRIRLVFVADEIPPELRRVVEFLNEQMDPAEVLAVEVRQYVGGDLRTLVPTIVGQTAESQQRKRVTSDATQWDESRFMDALGDRVGPGGVEAARQILAWATGHVSRVYWGKGERSGGFVPVVNRSGIDYQLFAVATYGSIEVYFQHYVNKPPFDDEGMRRELQQRLNRVPGVAIPDDALRRRPTIDIKALAQRKSVPQLLDVFDWYIEQLPRS